MLVKSPLDLLLLTAIIIALFSIFVLIRKRKPLTADYLLFIWIGSSAYALFTYLLVSNGLYLEYPALTVFGFSMPILAGPLLYLYFKYQTKNISFQKRDLLHFLPFVISSCLFIEFYGLSHEEQVAILRQNGKGFELHGAIKTLLIYVSGIVYISLSFYDLYLFRRTMKQVFSNTDKLHFNWLIVLNCGLLCIWIIVLFIQNDAIIFGAAAVYITGIAYFGITQKNVYSLREMLLRFPEKEPQESTDAEADNHLYIETFRQLQHVLETDKMYLNPELKVIDLANALQLHPNYISKVINKVSDANFYELINRMRVEAFLAQVAEGELERKTILGIAYDAGFNSKASFNRNFKLITGKSPSEFLSDQKRESQF